MRLIDKLDSASQRRAISLMESRKSFRSIWDEVRKICRKPAGTTDALMKLAAIRQYRDEPLHVFVDRVRLEGKNLSSRYRLRRKNVQPAQVVAVLLGTQDRAASNYFMRMFVEGRTPVDEMFENLFEFTEKRRKRSPSPVSREVCRRFLKNLCTDPKCKYYHPSRDTTASVPVPNGTSTAALPASSPPPPITTLRHMDASELPLDPIFPSTCRVKCAFLVGGIQLAAPSEFELDSGAARSFINSDFANQLIRDGAAFATNSPAPEVEFGNQSTSRAVGEILCKVEGLSTNPPQNRNTPLGTIYLRFIVMDRLTGRALFGRDAIATWRIQPIIQLPSLEEVQFSQAQLDREYTSLLSRRPVPLLHMEVAKGPQTPDPFRDARRQFRSVFGAAHRSPQGLSSLTSLTALAHTALSELFDLTGAPSAEFLQSLTEEELWAQVTTCIPIYRLPPLDESVLSPVRTALRGLRSPLPADLPSAARTALSLLTHMGPIALSRGYSWQLLPLGDHAPDVPDQSFRAEVSWSLTTSQTPLPSHWPGSALVNKLKPVHREAYEASVDKYISTGWWRPTTPPSSTTEFAEVFPAAPTDAKTTKCRPVVDARRYNAQSSPVSSSQLSTAQAVTELRGALQPHDKVQQLDLDQAFYRVYTNLRDKSGQTIPIHLRTHRGHFISNRLVFGLAVGPLGLIGTVRVFLEVTRELLRHRGFLSTSTSVKVIQVMDDFLLVGPAADVDTFETHFEAVFSACGFSSSPNKRWTWSATVPTRWLGATWLWNPATAQLTVFKERLEASPIQLSKRNTYAVAGEAFSVTHSFSEAVAVGHANIARKLVGRCPTWDQPVDLATAEAASFHLTQMKQHWNSSLEECLPLFSSITQLCMETDASLVGSGFSCQDALTDTVLFAESFISAPSMKNGEWHCNRCELHTIFDGTRRLLDRIHLFPKLQTVMIQTDSMVAAAHCDQSSRPSSGSLERTMLRRVAHLLHLAFEELADRKIIVSVSHIAGIANARADFLSRLADAGNYQSLVFRLPHSLPASHPPLSVHRIATTDSVPGPLDPDLNLLGLPSFLRWSQLYCLFRHWRSQDNPPTIITPQLFSQFIRSAQDSDAYCASTAASIGVQQPSRLFELHHGILFLREPIASNYPRAGWKHQRLRLVLPSALAAEYALLVHRQCGHLGRNSTLARCRDRIDCADFVKVVRSVLASCTLCQTATARNSAGQLPLGPVPLPLRSFSVLGVDLFGPLRRPRPLPHVEGQEGGRKDPDTDTDTDGTPDDPITHQKTPHILTICCRRTGYTRFAVLPNAEASSVCKHLSITLRTWGCEGVVEEIWSDNGKQFLSAAFQALVKRLPGVFLGGPAAENSQQLVRHMTIPVRTPHLGGHWETHHREAKKVFRALLAEWPHASWDTLASYAEAKVNFHREAGYPSPHQLVFGFEPQTEAERLPLSVMQQNVWDSKRPHFSHELVSEARQLDAQRAEFNRVWDDRFREMRVSSARRSRRAPHEQPLVKIGSLVLLPNEAPKNKFSLPWIGPFAVTEIKGKLLRVENFDRLWSQASIKIFNPSTQSHQTTSTTSPAVINQRLRTQASPPSSSLAPQSRRPRGQVWTARYQKSGHGRTLKPRRRD